MSDADRCFPFPQAHRFVNGGIINLALFLRRRSLMRNPLSAIISSPGRIRSKNPQSLVMYLSDTFPPHSFETYVMAPDGEIHTRALKVLCCLYELNVWDWAVGFLGFFIKKTLYSQLCLLHLGNSVGTIQAEIVLLHSEMAISKVA